MNIFFLHYDPKQCAQYHLDKHVVKMILETAQMLYSVHWFLELELPENAYKKTHVNHPCLKLLEDKLKDPKSFKTDFYVREKFKSSEL